MLICDQGHRTKIYVHLTVDDKAIYAGVPDTEQLRDILAVLDEGVCPVCENLDFTDFT